MIKKTCKNKVRKRKHLRVRKKISGTPERPRLCVFRSNSHIYAQVIDDVNGDTLVSASTLDQEIREKKHYGGNVEGASEVGKLIAARALARASKPLCSTAAVTSTMAGLRRWQQRLVKPD